MSCEIHAPSIFTLYRSRVHRNDVTERMRSFRHVPAAPIWAPLIVLLILSLVIWIFDLDRGLQKEFWSSDHGWNLAGTPWVQFLYHYGTWPALILTAGGLVTWILSFVVLRLKPGRQLGCFLVIAM